MEAKLAIRLKKSDLSDMYTSQKHGIMTFGRNSGINYDERPKRLYERKSGAENKLEYFRKLILQHISNMEQDNPKEAAQIQKAFSKMLKIAKGGKGLPVGTVRDWKGREFIKVAQGKWRPKYDSQTRGAKMAISALKKKISAAKDGQEMMNIILENRDRFSDKKGNPLAFVQELSAFIEQEQEGRTNKESEKLQNDKNSQTETTTSTENKTVSNGDKERAFKTLSSWANESIFDEAEGMSKEEIFEKYGNKIEPIAILPKNLLSIFGNITDTNIYCGKGYFIDHMVNHHPEIDVSDYRGIQNIIDEHKNIYEDSQTKSIVFDNNSDAQKEFIVLKLDNENRITFYKTFYYGKKVPKKLKKINPASDFIEKQGEESDVGERSTISRSDKPNPAASISARSDSLTIPQTKNKSSDKSGDDLLKKIKDNYTKAKSITGDEDEIQVGKELITGKWKLVEASAPAASHDESTFQKTSGFPVNKDGSTINDRGYEHDTAAQEAVINIAADFDGRALKFDSPVVVSKDGIVVSGNNRTMSSKIAAKKGTDGAYIEALKKRAKKFGFSLEQIEQFKNPRVVFEIETDGYTTEQFAKFNQSGKKELGPTEKAVKVSKLIKSETVQSVAETISTFETLGEMYADKKAVQTIFASFKSASLIGEYESGKYIENGSITEDGKTFIETALLGSVMSESNIRGFNRAGCKSIRSTLVRAITPLIENRGMSGYSINGELNEAVDIAMQVAVNKDKFKNVADIAKQENLFEKLNPVAVEIAKKLEGTQKSFADFMQGMNGGLKYAANGEADIFLGGVESKDDILSRILGVKKSITKAVSFFKDLLYGKQNGFVKKAVKITDENGNITQELRWIAASDDVIDEQTDSLTVNKKTVAVDFDGVINTFTSGWQGPTATDEPVYGAIESLRILIDRGYNVVIYSTRAKTAEGKDAIRAYLNKYSGDGTLGDVIDITDKKPIAHVYIDDRAVRFCGNWQETLKQVDSFKTWTEKSFETSGYKLQGRTCIKGLDIAIENRRGSIRSGTDKDGHDWSVAMNYDYGYIVGAVGKDKDYLDVYIGGNPESNTVFIVHQNDPSLGTYDEDKIMLCFTTESDARKAYLSQYDRPGFLGEIESMDIETFKEKAFNKKNKGKMLRG